MYGITNYAVTCDNKLFCFAGSDIMDAENIKAYLSSKFKDKEFKITDEFMDFSR